jgi:GNAT superfamily N-acetyltransferase
MRVCRACTDRERKVFTVVASPDAADLSVVLLPAGESREPYVPMLLLADEPEPLRHYLDEGDLYVLLDRDGSPLGATVVIPDAGAENTLELRAVAIAEGQHNRGLGQVMVRGVIDDLASRGARRIIVGTSNAGIGQIAFYQKAGFRLWRIEQDYFTAEKGYDPDERENGLPHRDMVWFEWNL